MQITRSRQITWLGLASTALVLAVQPCARADKATDAAKGAISKLYAEKGTAAERRDIVAYWKHRADDYVWISKHGKRVTAEHLKPGLARMFDNAESIKDKSVIEKFTLKGQTATVNLLSSGSMVVRISESQTRTIAGHDRSIDTWVKRDGQWRLKQSKVYEASMKIDGKPTKY